MFVLRSVARKTFTDLSGRLQFGKVSQGDEVEGRSTVCGKVDAEG